MSEQMPKPHNKVDAIQSTERWLNEVVVRLNFCPFAGREVSRGSIRFVEENELELAPQRVVSELAYLDDHSQVETTLIIFPKGWADFRDYLDFVGDVEQLLTEMNYEGVYQLATFHPAYQFAGTESDDPTNYTNRSPFPMIHILREESLERAIQIHGEAEAIPDANIAKATELGLDHMKQLLVQCYVQSKH